MDIYTYIGLCTAGVTAACFLGQRIATLTKRAREAEQREAMQARRAAQMEAERDTLKARYDARRDHYCLIREAENEALQQELKSLKRRYQLLEEHANRMWPKNCEGGSK